MNLYIDESGSMTTVNSDHNPYFVVSIVQINDKKKVKRCFKRFVAENLETLREIDKQNRMFNRDGRFKELKGSELTPGLKKKFMERMFRDNNLSLYYIVLDNKRINPAMYANTARAFNYCVKLALSYFIKKKLMNVDINKIEIDERNERTKTKFFLQEYLNTELILHDGVLKHNVEVEYFDSANNIFIQIADVFANIKYSDLWSNAYKLELKKASDLGYIKKIFNFPQKNYERILTNQFTYDIL